MTVHADVSLAEVDLKEQARLAALDSYDILDTPREEAFDRIARLARKLFQVPMATVSLIDGHRQWFKACEGLGTTEAPRQLTFCNITLRQSGPLVVLDALNDPRFAHNPFVTGEPHVRFYAGAPLRTREGHNVGTLCVVDTRPREIGPEQIELLSDLATMAMDELELRMVATTDSLTGASSRRAFKQETDRSVALALRHHHELSCVVFDLDRFKSVNDTHGHPAGDKVLIDVVRAAHEVLRSTDMLGRLGGEEFAVLLAHTGRAAALETAERLRVAISELKIDLGSQLIGITASFGVASLDTSARDTSIILEHADAALYEAKRAGRNRCIAWQPPPDERAQHRRRVLKGGKIHFNGRNSSMDCTVRSLSDDGAGLDLYETLGVPKTFDLAINADKFERSCRITSQTDKHLEVEFC